MLKEEKEKKEQEEEQYEQKPSPPFASSRYLFIHYSLSEPLFDTNSEAEAFLCSDEKWREREAREIDRNDDK